MHKIVGVDAKSNFEFILMFSKVLPDQLKCQHMHPAKSINIFFYYSLFTQ